jgi:hypothetical protein
MDCYLFDHFIIVFFLESLSTAEKKSKKNSSIPVVILTQRNARSSDNDQSALIMTLSSPRVVWFWVMSSVPLSRKLKTFCR